MAQWQIIRSNTTRVISRAEQGPPGAAGAKGATGATGATGPAGPSSVSDAVFEVFDNVDNTKKIVFQISGIGTGTTRTFAFPNVSGTIALTADLAAYAPLAGATFTGQVTVTNAEGLRLLDGAGDSYVAIGIGGADRANNGRFNIGIPDDGGTYGLTILANTVISVAAASMLDDATVSDMVNTLFGASSSGTGGAVRTTGPTITGAAIQCTNTGFSILDTNASHALTLKWNSNDTSNRTLSIVMGADRTVTFNGNLTVSSTASVSGTNTGDQNLAGLASLSGDNTFTGTQLIDNSLQVNGSVGFYGTSPIAQQTGVAVSAAGVHAALVNLGLITA